MIPIKFVKKAKKEIPWKQNFMVEQDLIISRALISLYDNPIIKQTLAFRGGTALNKLFLNPPARYSEDIDFVQIKSERIGPTSKAIRDSLYWLEEEAGLGAPEHSLKKYGLKYFYKFPNIDGSISKLKIEVNTREHFHVEALQKLSFSIKNDWYTGSSFIKTYSLEELMGTKLRALYQRRKGRDLFDLWYVFNKTVINVNQVVNIFHKYNQYNGEKITKKSFIENVKEKHNNTDFRKDINALLPPSITYDFETAYEYVLQNILIHI